MTSSCKCELHAIRILELCKVGVQLYINNPGRFVTYWYVPVCNPRN